MQDFEKLGAFYLGRPYDLQKKEPREGLLLYDSRDLVTHAVCVGMTGSGKTGLCVCLLEEAAIDRVDMEMLGRETMSLAVVLNSVESVHDDLDAFRGLCASWRASTRDTEGSSEIFVTVNRCARPPRLGTSASAGIDTRS